MVCDHKDLRSVCGSGETPLNKCAVCGLIFNGMPPKSSDPAEVYKDFYRNEMPGVGRFSFGIEAVIRLFRLFRAFKIFTIYPRARSILDIGSGRGFTLYYLKKYFGYKRAAGTQIARNAYEFSRNVLALEVHDKDLLDIPFEGDRFDIVSMWHVLEHVRKPEEYLGRISGLLNERGRLIIEVPNFSSWTRAFTGRYWLGLDPKHHLTFFTPESLTALLKKYGLKVRMTHTFSLEYSTFISTQSLVSFFTKSDHLIFRYLQKGAFDKRLAAHIFLFIVIAPVSFLVNLILFFSRRGEVLFIVAQKDRFGDGK